MKSRFGGEPPEAGNDARREPTPPIVEAGDPRPRPRAQHVRDPSRQRVQVERREVRDPVPHATHLEGRCRAQRDEPGEGARQAIEVRLHQGALLVLEELEVARPDEIIGRPSCLRAPSSARTRRPGRSPRSRQDGRVVRLGSQQRAERSIPSSAVTYARWTQKMSSKMALFVARIVFTSLRQQQPPAAQAVGDVEVSVEVGVQPEREQSQSHVVRRDRRHPRPLEARGLACRSGHSARDLHVAVERAARVVRRLSATSFHPAIVSGVPFRRTSSCGWGNS